jgi:uncharacterized protein YutE (UPF0331/DUF86 family)
MNRESAALIRQLLVSLNGYVTELTPLLPPTLPAYRSPPANRRAAERLVQLVVESAIDCGERILDASGKAPPSTAREVFTELERLGTIDAPLAGVFARRYVGLRNRIVHDYSEIDDNQVLSAGRKLLADAAQFIRVAAAWVDSQST